MIIFGLYETFKIKPLDINSNFYLFLLLSSLLVIIFGILRAYTTHFWINDDGLIMRQGNYVTLILWITAIVCRMTAPSQFLFI